MKITIADIKKQIRIHSEKLKICDSVEEIQSTLATISSLVVTIDKTLREVNVTVSGKGEPISLKEFLKILKEKKDEKRVLEGLSFIGKMETERKNRCLQLCKEIQEGLVLYNRFVYSTEFEVESEPETIGTGT